MMMMMMMMIITIIIIIIIIIIYNDKIHCCLHVHMLQARVDCSPNNIFDGQYDDPRAFCTQL